MSENENDKSKIYEALGSLKSEADERSRQLDRVFVLIQDTHDKMTEVLVAIEGLTKTDEHLGAEQRIQLAACRERDKELSERIEVLEEDRQAVRGAAKIAVWFSSVIGLGSALVAGWHWIWRNQ